jgi:ferredoxin
MTDLRLIVDPIRCDADGHCAKLLPELIELDERGYPIVPGPGPRALQGEAREVVAACPRLALRLERRRERDTARGSVPERRVEHA